jgi:hypothetical protein
VTHTKRIAGGLAVAGSILLLAGCGGDSEDRTPSPTTTVARTRTTVTTTTVPPTTAVDTRNDLGGTNPFAASGPWNTPVQSLDRASTSNRMIRLGADQPVRREDQTRLQRRDTTKNLAINLTGWAPGVYAVGQGNVTTLICRQSPCGKRGDLPPSQLRLPADLVSDSGHDGWIILVDQSTNTVWDLWRARNVNNTLSFAFVRKWQLDGEGIGQPASREPNRIPSVRGSGLPMLAGLIRPRELRAGRIPHTLAMAVPGPASTRFVLPAGTTNGLAPLDSLPQGARIRLKPSAYRRFNQLRFRSNRIIRVNGRRVRSKRIIVRDGRRKVSRGTRAVLQALYTYGAIIVDRADSPTLYAQRNADYSNLIRSNSLSELKLTDFEVVRLGTVYRDPAAPPPARPSQESR